MSELDGLLEAERMARQLFDLAQSNGVFVPGSDELTASDEIKRLAKEHFDISAFWHKRIVRSGANTVHPYAINPPVREFMSDDILFLDFGPVLEQWEADLGRTYVIGSDPAKLRVRDDTARIWQAGRDHFVEAPEITAAELFAYMDATAREAGYTLGEQRHVGHHIGEFPHERVEDDEITSYISPGNDLPMRRLDPAGRRWNWILECHLVDGSGEFGGFFEQLLV